MSDATVTRIGQADASGDALALFLKVFGGEVLTAFETVVIMKDKHMVRQIKNGKTAQFPATWKVGSSYHTPGAEIVGKVIKNNERNISVDGLLISDVFLASIDELMSHFDVRGPYSTEMGRELAKQYDMNVGRVVTLAARSGATVNGGNGGTLLTNAAYATDASVLAKGIFDAAQALDEKDVPDTDRYAAFKPAQYYLLGQNTNLMNRDWGGAGSYSEGKVPIVAGVTICKSNNMPFGTDDSANANIPTTYRADFTNTRGLVFHKMAAGTVTLLNLAMESAYDVRRQGTLLVGKYASGHGILRPECSVELKIA